MLYTPEAPGKDIISLNLEFHLLLGTLKIVRSQK